MKQIEIIRCVTLPHAHPGGKINMAKYTKGVGEVIEVGKDISQEQALKYLRGGIAWIPNGICLDADPQGRRGWELARRLTDEDQEEICTPEEVEVIRMLQGKPVKEEKPQDESGQSPS